MNFKPLFASLALAAAATSAFAQPKFLHPDRIKYDSHCFTIDGKDTFIFSGAFHYFRCPKSEWRARFQKIKDAGFNAVETYTAWNWSEKVKPSGPSDMSHANLKDLDEWLTMAEKEFGLYTIVRPGPYICAEWATGGFPNWLISFKPEKTKRDLWFRSDDPVFEEWSAHWYTEVANVVRKHQLTNMPKGSHGVILWQVENEYGGNDEMRRNYTKFLIQTSLKLGIEVPLFSCWTAPVRYPQGDPDLSQAFDNPNLYDRWQIQDTVNAIKDQHDAEPWAPKMVTEFQGGWFGQVGGLAAEEQDGITATQQSSNTLLAMANGLTGLNYYMLFGGTNFGDWAAEGLTTSYDYFAPVREWGGGGEKYRAMQQIGMMLKKYGSDIARSDLETSLDQPNLKTIIRKGASGAQYVFVWNSSREKAATGTVAGVSFDLKPFAMNVYRFEGADASKGEWLIKDVPAPAESLPTPIRLNDASVQFGTPTHWSAAMAGTDTLSLGIYDSRFLFYKFGQKQEGSKYLWLQMAPDCELISPSLTGEKKRQGGEAYAVPTTGAISLLLNPGWPNGGSGMEQTKGIKQALLLNDLPSGQTVQTWKSKRVDSDQDRSLVGVDVDTSGWDPDANTSRFPENTTVVVRGEIDLDKDPDPSTVLASEGVDDYGWFFVNGHEVGFIGKWGVPGQFKAAQYLHKGKNVIAIVIHNVGGEGGLSGAVALTMPLPASKNAAVEWTDKYTYSKADSYGLDKGLTISRNEHPKISGDRKVAEHLLVKSTINFDKPATHEAWELLIEAGGDGFLSLNGQPLGRYWESGPQRGFYLPPSMLKEHNVLTLEVVPGRLGDRIKAAELRPLPMN